MLNKGTDVVVGTPGRMKDMINKGTLKFTDLKVVALDEVDRMLDMGFADDVDELIGSVYQRGQKPQTLFFSATVPTWVKGKFPNPQEQNLTRNSRNGCKIYGNGTGST